MTRFPAAVIGAALIATGCGGDGGGRGGPQIVTTTTSTTSTTNPSTTSTTEIVTGSTNVPTSPTTPTSNSSASRSIATTPQPTSPTPAVEPTVGDPRVAIETIGEFESPVGAAARPGDDTGLFVIEQGGRVVRLDIESLQRTVVADVSSRTSADGERGLLGLAFSLDGSLAYLDYTNNADNTVVAEYSIDPDGTFDVDDERVLLTIDQPYGNHNGGDLATAVDGTLIIAMGDGGDRGDPDRRASDPTDLLGALLRIDPTPSGDAPYSIPPDNPFADGDYNGIAGAPEVWAWGLRNPWKINFDPANGDLWIADVGQKSLEEVDHVASVDPSIPAGGGTDFGWSAFEGTERYNSDVADTGNTTLPVLTYGRDSGISISGGAVYRGDSIDGLAPAYVYSDFGSGNVWALDLRGSRNLTLLTETGNIAAVRTGPDGELYLLDIAGPVSRLVPG